MPLICIEINYQFHLLSFFFRSMYNDRKIIRFSFCVSSTSTLITMDITKTESNDFFVILNEKIIITTVSGTDNLFLNV